MRQCSQCDAKARSMGFCNKHYQALHYLEVKHTTRATYRATESFKEKERARVAEYRKQNPDKRRAADAVYRAAHKDKARAYIAEWNSKNRDVRNAHHATRRALKRGSSGSHTAAEVKKLWFLQQGCCAMPFCAADLLTGYHKDHILPLALGGSNQIDNIQLLCPTCNLSKRDKHPIDFMQSRGFLL